MDSKQTPDKFPEKIMRKYMGLNPDSKKRILESMFAKLDEKQTKSSPITVFSLRLWYFAIAASAIITVSLFFIFSLNNPQTAKVVDCWNYCRINKADGKVGRIIKGNELTAGDMLITGPAAGISIKTADGSFVSVGSNSLLEYTAPRGGKMCTFFLHRGSILAKVSPDKTKLFSVQTPSALLKVLGTEFEAKVLSNPINKTEKNKMISKIKNKTAALTVLTVLTGTVAVNPASATETTVGAGSIANISSGNVKVSPIKVRKFINSVISSNYRKASHLWLSIRPCNGLLNSLYRYDPVSGANKKIADFIGYAKPEGTQIESGVIISLNSVLINNLNSFNGGSGNTIVNCQLMVITTNGDLLSLESIAKYSPWYPALSPDGTKLAFLGRENKDSNAVSGLYVMDFSNLEVRRIYTGALKTVPAWSPDSAKILITKRTGYTAKHRIISISVNSGKVAETDYDGCGITFSPDGKYIAFPGNFRRGGAWFKGVPVSGDMFVARYPDGKPVRFNSGPKGGAIMPVFSPDGKSLAYLWKENTDNELHIVDLADNIDRKICSVSGYIHEQSWVDSKKLILIGWDKEYKNKLIKLVDITESSATVKDLKPNYPENTEVEAVLASLKPAFELYLAGLKACSNNQLSKAKHNYQAAYNKLLKLRDEISNIDPDFKLESLAPYIIEFKKHAEMDVKSLYMEQLRYRMTLFPSMLNLYVRKNKSLPESMDKLADYISEHSSYNYIMAKTHEAKIQFLMPDQTPGSKSAFEIKIIDENNVEFYSAPTPFGKRYKIKAVKGKGSWNTHGEIKIIQ